VYENDSRRDEPGTWMSEFTLTLACLFVKSCKTGRTARVGLCSLLCVLSHKQPFDCGKEALGIEWLWLVRVRTKLKCECCGACAERGRHQNWRLLKRGSVAHAPYNVNAVGTRHLDVGDYQIRPREERRVVTSDTIIRDRNFVAARFERHPYQLARDIIIFDY